MNKIALIITIAILSIYPIHAQLNPDSLENIANKSNSLNEKYNIITSLCYYYIDSHPAKTIDLASSLLNLLKNEENSNKEIGNLHSILGEAYYLIDDNENALTHFLFYLDYAKKGRNQESIASAHNGLGIVYADNQQYDKAIKAYKEALKINENLSNKNGISSNLNNIGVLYEKMSEFEKALDYYERSLKLEFELKNYTDIATSLLNIGAINEKLKNYNKAIQYCKESIIIADTLNLFHTKELAYKSLYKSYKATNNYLHALLAYENHIDYKSKRLNQESQEMIAEVNAQYENVQKEQEILHLQYKSRLNKLVIFISLISIVVLSILVVLLIKENRKKKEKNYLLLHRNEEINQQKEEILAQRDEIEAQRNLAFQQRDEIMWQKQHITDSITYAKHIQNTLLPGIKEIKTLLSDGFCYFKPLDIVSGDFYWVKNINKYAIIAVADCTGHGVPGAFMSVMGISFLNNLIIEQGFIDPGLMLNSMNKKIKNAFSHHEEKFDNFNGMDISILVINKETNEMNYACAKNKIIRISNGKMEILKGENKSIGRLVAIDDFYKTYTIQLNKNDMLYIYSDGYTDQIDNNSNEKFKQHRFESLLKNIYSKPLSHQMAMLERTLQEWMGNNKQIDDILILGLKI